MRDDPTVVALVARARAGDADAWDGIVRRYADLIWAICRRFGLAGGDADDVAAAVWLRLVERLGTIREPAALPGWIATTARRECLQARRSAARTLPLELERYPAGTDPVSDEWLLAEERRHALRVAFAELPERCRRLLALLFREPPMPYVEIGETLQMKVPSIGPTRMRCLDRLRGSPVLAALSDAAPAPQR